MTTGSQLHTSVFDQNRRLTRARTVHHAHASTLQFQFEIHARLFIYFPDPSLLRKKAKALSPLFNLHACQCPRMFIYISFIRLFSQVCFQIRWDLEKKGEDARGGCRHTRPQCPSVNSISASICVCVCVCSVLLYSPPLGSLGWWPLYVAPLSHSFKSRSFACHTLPFDTHTGGHSHSAWHAISLKRQQTQMWQQINFVWPRSTQGRKHMHKSLLRITFTTAFGPPANSGW